MNVERRKTVRVKATVHLVLDGWAEVTFQLDDDVANELASAWRESPLLLAEFGEKIAGSVRITDIKEVIADYLNSLMSNPWPVKSLESIEYGKCRHWGIEDVVDVEVLPRG